jgi:hypothetical protein
MLPIITALLPILGGVLDKVIPDTAEAEKAKAELQVRMLEAANAANVAQIEANKEEAKHVSVFVAGWRPAIGWVGAAALGWQFVVGPLVVWGAGVLGHAVPPLMPLDENLWGLIAGILGLGGLRSWEKSKGVAR